MKFFFNTLKECNKDLQVYMENSAENNTDVNIYEVMACYFTDIIGSVIFGVKANSFKQSDATFRKLGRDLFRTFTLPFRILLFLMICYPKLAKLLGVGNIQPEIEKFMFDFVPETIEYRTKHNIYRSDFLQLLIELKNSGVNLSEQEIVAQSFLFFTAGFETSSATSTFILYELGLHKDIQDKVRQEVIAVYKKYNYDFTYESLQEMTYFNQVFNETTRKYPLLTTLNRVCLTDYQFPDSDVVIEKGTGVILPVLSYHRNADVFTDPEKWDPDRFEEPSVKYDGYFPFGDGPRNCIGGRFGKMQVMLGVAEIIRNYDISVNPKTKQPLEFDTTTFVTSTTETVYLNFKGIINID